VLPILIFACKWNQEDRVEVRFAKWRVRESVLSVYCGSIGNNMSYNPLAFGTLWW
jgi:hypothetical protein